MNLRPELILACLTGVTSAGTASAASLPAAPAGYTWQFVNAATYTDSDTGTLSLAANGNVNSGPAIASISETLSLTTFNEASAPAGQFYCVTASSFTTSLLASTNSIIFNFTPGSDGFYGTGTLAGMSIGGSSGASAGPLSSGLTRPPVSAVNVPSFGTASFLDAATGAAATSINLSDTGTVAVNNGSDLTFTFTGTEVNMFNSTSGGAGSIWITSGSASFSAAITTAYDVFRLVAIPVPEASTAAFLGSMGLLLAGRRRRQPVTG